MKKLCGLLLCGFLLVSVSACSSKSEKTEGCKLTVSTFQLSEDIVNDDVVKPFEEKYNCDVVTGKFS